MFYLTNQLQKTIVNIKGQVEDNSKLLDTIMSRITHMWRFQLLSALLKFCLFSTANE